MNKRSKLLFLLLLLAAATGCSAGETAGTRMEAPVELTVSAAASMQNVLQAVQKNFEREHPDIHIVYNFGSSGTLQQQIFQGAPVDLFVSASAGKFKELDAKGHIDPVLQGNLAGNSLVLIVPEKQESLIRSAADLVKAETISIGTPETVPAGKYAKEALEALGMWEETKEKIVYAKNVRQVLAYVETGNVDAGIVYKTDALISDRVQAIPVSADALHAPIVYPAGVTAESLHPEEAALFYSYLQGEEAAQELEKHGFEEMD